MNRAQTTMPSTGTSTGGRGDRDLLDAIFATLAAASAFVPLGSTHPTASFDPELRTVARFRGWIDR